MKNVKHRLLFPMQAKGNVGKSLEIATRACWLSERGIEWQGFDLDADNRTLSRLFPGEVQLVAMTGRADDQDEMVSILKKVTAKPVTIVDARAHLDGVLRTALKATRFFNLAKQLNIGITVSDANILPSGYAMVMEGIYATEERTNQNGKEGIIYFSSQRKESELESIKREAQDAYQKMKEGGK